LEQRIRGDLDFVIMNARRFRVEPDGVGISDEVDLVAAAGQFHSQLRRHDAAAAVRGIAGDADVHLASVACGLRRYNARGIGMQRSLKFLGVWISCVLALEMFIFGSAFVLGDFAHRIALSKSWTTTTGRVVAVDRDNHNSVTVRYSVEGRVIDQTFQGSKKEIGQPVNVYYSRHDATLADIRNPSVSVPNDVRFLSLLGLVFGTFCSMPYVFRAFGQVLGWPWTRFRLTPRFAMTAIAAGVFIGTVANLFSRRGGYRLWMADVLVVCGTALLCIRTYRVASETTFWIFVKSRLVIVGVLLVVAGQLVSWGQW